jgi:hypothetical protein
MAHGYEGPGNFVTRYPSSDAELWRSFAGVLEGGGLSTLRLMESSSSESTFSGGSWLLPQISEGKARRVDQKEGVLGRGTLGVGLRGAVGQVSIQLEGFPVEGQWRWTCHNLDFMVKFL